jgi:hypothetical protein
MTQRLKFLKANLRCKEIGECSFEPKIALCSDRLPRGLGTLSGAYKALLSPSFCDEWMETNTPSLESAIYMARSG